MHPHHGKGSAQVVSQPPEAAGLRRARDAQGDNLGVKKSGSFSYFHFIFCWGWLGLGDEDTTG